MKVQVEIEYSAVPPPEEVENIRRAGLTMAPDANTVSVRRGETDEGMPAIILDFEMKTQPEYKVVDDIAHGVHAYISGKFYSDLVIRFPRNQGSGLAEKRLAIGRRSSTHEQWKNPELGDE